MALFDDPTPQYDPGVPGIAPVPADQPATKPFYVRAGAQGTGYASFIPANGTTPTTEEVRRAKLLAQDYVPLYPNAPRGLHVKASAAEPLDWRKQLQAQADAEAFAKRQVEQQGDLASGLTAMAGNVTAGLAFAPETGGFSVPASVIGGAVGAGIGKFAGQDPARPLGDRFDNARRAALWDLVWNGGLAGAGALKNAALWKAVSPIERSAESAGLGEALRLGTKTGVQPAMVDIGRPWIRNYFKVASSVPLVSGPARALQNERGAGVVEALARLRGPVDDGLATIGMGTDLHKAAENALGLQVDAYGGTLGAAEQLARAHPEARFNFADIRASADAQAGADVQGTVPIMDTQTRNVVTQREATTGRSKLAQATTTGPGTTYSSGFDETGAPVVGSQAILPTKTLTEGAGPTQPFATTTTKGATLTSAKTTRSQVRLAQAPSGTIAQWMDDLRQYPDKLNYWQLRKFSQDLDEHIAQAKGTGYENTLLAMRRQLDDSWDSSNVPGLNTAMQQARAQFRNTQEWLGNPTAQKFQLAEPDVWGGLSGTGPSPEKDALFEKVLKGLSPDGMDHLESMVGADNTKRALQLDWRQRVNKYMPTADNPDINWDGLRGEFGLNDPTSAKYAATKAALKRLGMDSPDEVGAVIDHLENMQQTINLPATSTMMMRRLALGSKFSLAGLGMGIGGYEAHKHGLIGDAEAAAMTAVSLGTILGARRLSQFLTDPERLRALVGATRAVPLSMPQATGQAARYARSAAVRELGRWAAQSMVDAGDVDSRTRDAQTLLGNQVYPYGTGTRAQRIEQVYRAMVGQAQTQAMLGGQQ